MDYLRTPDERFLNLPGYNFTPHYVEIKGLRMHYIDEPGSSGNTDRNRPAVASTDVHGLRTKQTIGGDLFQAMRGPACDAPCRKHRGEERRRELDAVQQERRVEFDVGLQRPRRLVLAQ